MAREIYYAVMTIYTATKENVNFPGEVQTWINGKEDKVLFAEGTSDHWNDQPLYAYRVREYGYKRMCDAKRNYSYTHQESESKSWIKEVRIVSLWVRKDGKVDILI